MKALLLFVFFIQSSGYALVNGKIGNIDLSSSLTATYDSNLFGLQENEFINNQKTNQNLKSRDDLILKLSPILHYSKEVSLITMSGSAGVEIANFMFNDSRSYIIPVTTFNLDFDESIKKRISTNSKIRFSLDFDLGQSVGTDLTEGDLVSYTFFNTNLSIRYNHSPKFGLGSGINYEIREYQTGVVRNDYQDLSALPISSDLFYIYSPKLDFFLNHVYSKTKTSGDSSGMGNTISNSYSFGANGVLSPKLSGKVSLGYSRLSFENANYSSKDSAVSNTSLSFKHNQKTSSQISIQRNFSPTATSSSQISTSMRYNLNHSFNSVMNGNVGISQMFSEVFINNLDSFEMKQFGFDVSLSRILSKYFTTMFSYNYNLISRNNTTFNRHLISASITGRF